MVSKKFFGTKIISPLVPIRLSFPKSTPVTRSRLCYPSFLISQKVWTNYGACGQTMVSPYRLGIIFLNMASPLFVIVRKFTSFFSINSTHFKKFSLLPIANFLLNEYAVCAFQIVLNRLNSGNWHP